MESYRVECNIHTVGIVKKTTVAAAVLILGACGGGEAAPEVTPPPTLSVAAPTPTSTSLTTTTVSPPSTTASSASTAPSTTVVIEASDPMEGEWEATLDLEDGTSVVRRFTFVSDCNESPCVLTAAIEHASGTDVVDVDLEDDAFYRWFLPTEESYEEDGEVLCEWAGSINYEVSITGCFPLVAHR